MPSLGPRRKGKRQRFYARNTLNTTLDLFFGRLMQPFQAVPAVPHDIGRIRPVLKGMADEFFGALARLIAYVCTLALLFMRGVYLWDQLPDMHAETSARPEWTVATRSTPAFASNQYDLAYKTRSYHILRHPEGGRRDVLRWNAENGRAIAEIEIYRPGGEFEPGTIARGRHRGPADRQQVRPCHADPTDRRQRQLPRFPQDRRSAVPADLRLRPAMAKRSPPAVPQSPACSTG